MTDRIDLAPNSNSPKLRIASIGLVLFLSGSAALLIASDWSHITSPVVRQQDTKEIRIQVSKPIDALGLTTELQKAGFQVLGVSPRGEPVTQVDIYLATTELKDPAAIVEAHDASKWGPNRPRLRITWQDDPILEPRVQEQYIIPGTSDAEIDLGCRRLKAKGAVSVEVIK
jgi:hypothetical protein